MSIPKDKQDTIDRYRARLREHGISPRALGWRPGSQEIRFRAFLKDAPLSEAKSLIDVGCGFGDLLGELRAMGWKGHYTGIDILPEFIEVARGRNEAGTSWVSGDFQELLRDMKADIVFSSGLFNHSTGPAHLAFVERSLQAMRESCDVFVAADFLSATADRRDAELHFMPSAELVRLVGPAKRFVVDHSYMPFEVMLKIWIKDKNERDLPYFEAPQT